jgi:hypothetical protein
MGTVESLYYEILEHEVRLARSVAISHRPVRPFSVWEVLIPIVFILGYMRSRRQRELFVQNFIFTKKLALKAARDKRLKALSHRQIFERIEMKTRQLLETLETNIYSQSIRQAQLVEMNLLISHYQRLFDTAGSKYGDCITAAYPVRENYLAFLNKLQLAEKDVAAAAIATVGAQADQEMVPRIETCTRQLRLKNVDRYYNAPL